MKKLLWAALAFLIGMNIGAHLALKAVQMGIRDASLEEVADRAVKDVSSAYQQQLELNRVFKRFHGKLDECLAENARLKQRRFYGN